MPRRKEESPKHCKKMGEYPRTRSRTRIDRLSELPLSIIGDILGHLPTIEVVRTSVLSRQWRYTWTSVPRLLFECDDARLQLKDGFEENTINSITNVLLNHKGPIHTFEMSYSYSFNFERVKISSNCGGNSLKSSVYSCTDLIDLVLFNFTMDPPPSAFKGFLFLKRLVLFGADLPPKGVETLVGNCPLLEILTLIRCQGSVLRIRSHKLKILLVSGDYKELCLYAPLLDRVSVDLTASQFKHRNQSLGSHYTDFFGGFTNLVELTGSDSFTRYLGIGIESCHTTSLVFHRLKIIQLSEVNFGDIKEISVVARLINGAPNLQKLKITSRQRLEDEALDVSIMDYQFAPLEKLKDVSLSFVWHYSFGKQLVKFLLETSPVLETMELRFQNSILMHRVSAKLSGFHRASANAKITLLKADPTF